MEKSQVFMLFFSHESIKKKIKMARDTTFKGKEIVNSPVKGDGVIIQLTSLLAVILKKKIIAWRSNNKVDNIV